MDKAQNLKNELDQFKKEQEELLQKFQEHQETEKTKQFSPATFGISGLEIPDNIEEAAQQEQPAQQAQPTQPPQPAYPSQPINTQVTSSKSKLALLTLEEEILTDSIEIYLPALRENVTVKPLKNIEELNLKTQNLTFESFLRQLNIILLQKTHIKSIPLTQYFQDVQDFEAKILPIDRLLMIYALVKNSFEKLADFNMICENCEKEFLASPHIKNLDFKFELSQEEIYETDYYNFKITQTFLNNKLEIDFGFNPEAFRMNLLFMKSKQELKENVNENNNILDALDNLIVFIKSIRVYKDDKRTKDGRKLVVEISSDTDGFNEIFEFIHDMPMKARDTILNESDLTKLEKFSPVFKIAEACPYCGYVNELDNSPEIEFFRKTLSLLR